VHILRNLNDKRLSSLDPTPEYACFHQVALKTSPDPSLIAQRGACVQAYLLMATSTNPYPIDRR
jgi:hypothetical protein